MTNQRQTAREKFSVGDRVRYSAAALEAWRHRRKGVRTATVVGFSRNGLSIWVIKGPPAYTGVALRRLLGADPVMRTNIAAGVRDRSNPAALYLLRGTTGAATQYLIRYVEPDESGNVRLVEYEPARVSFRGAACPSCGRRTA